MVDGHEDSSKLFLARQGRLCSRLQTSTAVADWIEESGYKHLGSPGITWDHLGTRPWDGELLWYTYVGEELVDIPRTSWMICQWQKKRNSNRQQ